MNINQKCINHLRALSCEMITNAKSGHPGVALGAATIMYALFKDHYFYDIKDTKLIARDRLVLSAGHASSLYYACAHMFNFGITEQDMKSFRKYESKTPGHPETLQTDFVEVSTGPLGQGVANAVGLAIGQSMLGARFGVAKYPIIDNYTYCFAGDGCLMEGVAQEALSLAGTLKLNKLIVLYDCNKITIDGSLDIANAENVCSKYKAMGFNVVVCKDGNNYKSVTVAIAKAKKEKNKPTMVVFKTVIGLGSQNAGEAKIHGTPLTHQQLAILKQNLKVETSFCLPDDVKNYISVEIKKTKAKIKQYNENLILYEKTNKELYDQFVHFMENHTFDVIESLKEDFFLQDMAGRDFNHIILNKIANAMPRVVGGSADLASSTKVFIDGENLYSAKNQSGRNIAFGIREHAMGAICNGICLYLKCPVFCSTFMAFSNYLTPAIRMSSLMELPVWYIFTHDSFKVGEDGPTHQSVEQLGSLRLMPNLMVFRPADSRELAVCYSVALKSKKPCAFVIAKQTLCNVDGQVENIKKGGYTVAGESGEINILATGSEVELALKVKDILQSQDVNCVVSSFPCLEVFESQTEKYKQEVLNKGKLIVALEASNDNVWFKYVKKPEYFLCVNDFGRSASVADLDEHFEWTATHIAKKLKKLLPK